MVPMLLVAALVGVASSIAVEGFRQAMDAVMRLYTTHEHLVAAAKALPPLALAAIPTLGATLEIAAILVAAVMGELTTQSLFATGPLYLSHTIPPVGFPDLLDATLLGVLAGVLGPAFLWLLDTARRGYQALVGFPPVRMGLMGLVIGLLSLLRPEVWGNGFSVVQSLLVDHWALYSVVAVLGLRLLATTAASAAGIPGGVLTPTLALGGALGLLVQQTMLLGGASHSQALWVLVGMGSLLAATTHAPVMSAIMVFEITRNYDVVLAAMLACVIGSVLGSLLRERSVYAEALGLPARHHYRSPAAITAEPFRAAGYRCGGTDRARARPDARSRGA
jgi:CIC family chloride channel protein